MIAAVIVFIILMALLGAPIFVVISAFAMVGFYATDIPSAALVVDTYNKFANNPILYTIPLFTFAGFILAESRASVRIVNFSRAVLGWLPGGFAIVALCVCAFFTAFTGASGVTIIALGGLLYPALIKERYPEKFSLGLLTSSGSLGLLFPPSLPIIIFGVVAETSINQLFVAGLIPGLLLILLLSMYSTFTGIRSDVVKEKISLRRIIKTTFDAKWELFIPAIVVVGIYGGYVTLGEMATLIVVYAFIVEVVIHREIKIRNLPLIMNQSMVLVGGILIILGSSMALTNYMIDAQVPMVILEEMQKLITSKWAFLIGLNIFLLLVGCIMDIYSALLVVVPLILPIAISYGIDPVHLGIIFLTNLEIGYSTPPVGMNLFISCFRFNKHVIELYRAAIPFIIILLIGLMLITYIPQLSLGLISILGIQ
ncbi:MAG: TRAP transporter large permease subunit [Desulfobacteraceae bacterium]|nr:TRAP transporter large permease subunit [Desulfobacteraceae bacterium]MBC2763596.1 TRAP transporter large permease subunit [ANME-2 cluster archaeon]